MRFENRTDAGEKLADRLSGLDLKNAVVLALPRGGVPVAAAVAERLGLPLDVIIVRKIGAPDQPELAVGAITKRHGVQVVVNKDIAKTLRLSDEDVARLGEPQIPVIDRRRREYFEDRSPVPIKRRTAIVVDDGVATGATARAALQLVRQEGPAKLILALPVAPSDTLAELAGEADEVVCLATPTPFLAVGTHYRDFTQVPDSDVVAALKKAQR
jgi:putative phosphoribosyl transferase